MDEQGTPQNGYVEFRPSLWQRIAWWSRWPWRPKFVHAEFTGETPYLICITEDGTRIANHHVDTIEVRTGIVLGRWTALRALLGRHPLVFEVEMGADPSYKEQKAAIG